MSPAPYTPAWASSVTGSTFSHPRAVCAIPEVRQASKLGRRPVATSRRYASTIVPDLRLSITPDPWASTATHGSPTSRAMPSASSRGTPAAPGGGRHHPARRRPVRGGGGPWIRRDAEPQVGDDREAYRLLVATGRRPNFEA